ncbi:MAG: hypothetical protein WAL83_00560 [Arenicellales bacterium]|jgi:hypothetical protein
MKLKPSLLVAAGLTAASVTGCATTGVYQSSGYRPSEGSTIELTQTLELSPGAARVYIQNGKARHWNEVNLWKPYCSFGLDRTRDGNPLAREIHPATFTTGNTRLGVYAALDPGKPLDVNPDSAFAARGVEVAGPFGNDGGGFPSRYTYVTSIALFSDEEPQVDDLTCAFDGVSVDRHLTMNQIQGTLGDVAKIH